MRARPCDSTRHRGGDPPAERQHPLWDAVRVMMLWLQRALHWAARSYGTIIAARRRSGHGRSSMPRGRPKRVKHYGELLKIARKMLG